MRLFWLFQEQSDIAKKSRRLCYSSGSRTSRFLFLTRDLHGIAACISLEIQMFKRKSLLVLFRFLMLWYSRYSMYLHHRSFLMLYPLPYQTHIHIVGSCLLQEMTTHSSLSCAPPASPPSLIPSSSDSSSSSSDESSSSSSDEESSSCSSEPSSS